MTHLIVKAKGKKTETKQAIIDAAIVLFQMHGYNGTSVRNIAAEAHVNVALVSYYFGSKKALLEHLMEMFFREYIQEIEEAIPWQNKTSSVCECLVQLAIKLLHYQQKNFYLSLLVHREVTIDSILVRELMTTYLMKEKYLMETIFEEGIRKHEICDIPIDLLVLQYRDMIVTPFLQPLYLRKVHVLEPSQSLFIDRYAEMIRTWIVQIKQGV